FRQRLNQVFQHGAQPAGNLNAGAAKLSNLRNRQRNEIGPVRSAVGETQPARLVAYAFIIETPHADASKQMVNLVDWQNGGGRVVDGWGETFGSDIDKNSKGQGRVLLHGAFLADCHGLTEFLFRQRLPTLEEPKEWIANGNEITDLRDHFNDAVCSSGK